MVEKRCQKNSTDPDDWAQYTDDGIRICSCHFCSMFVTLGLVPVYQTVVHELHSLNDNVVWQRWRADFVLVKNIPEYEERDNGESLLENSNADDKASRSQ